MIALIARLLREWIGDVRYGIRSLGRQPTFVAVALVTIALGTASTTSVLTVWNALVVRTVPVSDIRSLYVIDGIRSGAVSQPLSVDAIPYERFLAYRESLSEVFSGLAAERYRLPAGFSLVIDDAPVSANGYVVTANYFDVLGLVPAAGGFFTNDRDRAVVISFDLWHRYLGGDPAVLGRTLSIDSQPYTVVGVAPEGFQGTLHVLASDLWVPIEAYPQDAWVTLFGRLRPGVSREQAEAAVGAAALGIPPLQPQTRVRGAEVVPLTGLPPALQGPLERFLSLLFATGLVVLLIAAANIVGMLLARGVARRREVAVRLALGAGQWRLVRQALTETSLLFFAGGAAGLWLGALLAGVLEGVRLPLGVDMAVDFATDARVLVLSLGLTALVGALFGLLPSLQAARGDIVGGLKLITRGAAREAWGWRLFVRAQLAFSVLLLVTAGLFARSLQKAAAIDLGFDPEGMVVAQVDLSAHGYDEVRGRLLFRELVDQTRAVPGVTSASLASTVLLGPLYGRNSNDMRPRDEGAPEGVRVNAAFNVVEPEYFETLGLQLLSGRNFSSSDLPGTVEAAIVNEALAQSLWPGENPLGRRMSGGGQFEVVGVVRDAKSYFVSEPPTPYLFRAFSQDYQPRMTLHVRSELTPAQTLQEVRALVRGLDPNIALQGDEPLESVVGLTLFPQRFAAWLVGVFGFVGLVFAGIGVYGILHFHVSQRVHEMGIRVALGAHPRTVQRELVEHGAKLALVAVAVGLLGTAFVTRILRGLMIGVSPLDPLTFLVVALVLVGVAAGASWVPARRATRVDPVDALRVE